MDIEPLAAAEQIFRIGLVRGVQVRPSAVAIAVEALASGGHLGNVTLTLHLVLVIETNRC
jgi:hypothetical protein